MAAITVDRQEWLRRADELGVFPDVAVRIQRAVRDPRSDVRSIATIVRSDPALAGRLLKIANSPYYGSNRRVDNVERAVQLLGFRTTKDLAIALCLSTMGKAGQPEARLLWEHAICVAGAGRLLARYVRGVDSGSAFLLGLLHDVGRSLFLLLEPARYARLSKLGEGMLCRAETMAFGLDHAQLGAICLTHWSLPQTVCDVVGGHHGPIRSDAQAVLWVAEQLVEDPDPDVVLDSDAWRRLALREERLDRVLEVLAEELSALRSL